MSRQLAARAALPWQQLPRPPWPLVSLVLSQPLAVLVLQAPVPRRCSGVAAVVAGLALWATLALAALAVLEVAAVAAVLP